MKENLGNDDPSDRDQLVNEFRTFILAAESCPIQWENLPREKWADLRDRAKESQVGMEDLFELANWKSRGPDVTEGDWYRHFETFKLCGTVRFPSTFPIFGQPARGKRL